MSNSREEETYSTIFTSLKHPIRRKILRMLYEHSKSFSEMQETFRIESSHLTYHLENLKELIYKTDDGRYKLSTFGEAAVGTMRKVEEMPKVTEPKRLSSLPIKWKSFFAVLMIGLVALAGVCYVQYQALNRLPAVDARRDRVPVPKYRIDLNLDSANGFDEVISMAPPSGFPKLVLRQGEVGTVEITLKRLYTEETIWVTLSFYGIAPEFDKWILGLMENRALPEGVTYGINPSIMKLSTDEDYSSTLTIAVEPDAQTGSFKLTVDAYLIYTSGGQSGSSTGESFTLELKR
jgi:DNA-binding transcriptional ArsR family regulator